MTEFSAVRAYTPHYLPSWAGRSRRSGAILVTWCFPLTLLLKRLLSFQTVDLGLPTEHFLARFCQIFGRQLFHFRVTIGYRALHEIIADLFFDGQLDLGLARPVVLLRLPGTRDTRGSLVGFAGILAVRVAAQIGATLSRIGRFSEPHELPPIHCWKAKTAKDTHMRLGACGCLSSLHRGRFLTLKPGHEAFTELVDDLPGITCSRIRIRRRLHDSRDTLLRCRDPGINGRESLPPCEPVRRFSQPSRQRFD